MADGGVATVVWKRSEADSEQQGRGATVAAHCWGQRK